MAAVLHDTNIMPAARTKNIKTFAQIGCAVLERNSAISIIKKADQGS